MARVDSALQILHNLFEKWGWEDWQRECQKVIDDVDQAKARKWLYQALKRFEAFEDMDWTVRTSGVLLANAGLISMGDISLGAAALLEEVEILEEVP